ncbi:sensor domain-containing diguanylate cyclase [Arcobacter cloacae]|uniref:sensor domain-containing diguanylate cyclase n=1 Tax=Arcobacter cloacae TaxID=1054034 RepID=UPI00155D9A9E|nr:sensor domain-containing diguanylate cyclase [Arcobacter cloacae]QKF89260.1 diguanylate cyclase [Arcobacter cloacae]
MNNLFFNKIFNIKNLTYGWFLFSIIVIVIITLLQGYFEYKKSIKDAIIKTNNLTILLTKKLENDFDQANNILKFVENIIKTLPKENKIFQEANFEEKQKLVASRFNFLINNFKNISVINYLDANGNIIYSSNTLQDKINLSDRKHFLELKNNKDLMISFSDVIVSRTTNKTSLAQLLAIRDDKKELIGAISVLIDLEIINNILASIDTGKNGVALLRRSDDRTLISKYPIIDKSEINKQLPLNNDISVRIRAGEKSSSLEYIASTDGEKRLASFIVMDKYPFYVQVALSQEEYLKQWKRNLMIVLILIILFVLSAFLLFLVVRKSYKREQLSIDKQKELMNEVLKEKIKYETLLKLSSDAVFVVDIATSKILEYSYQTQKNLRYSNKEMMNLTIVDIDRDLKSVEEFKEIISNINSEIISLQRVHQRKDGTFYNASITAAKIRINEKDYIYSSTRDITEKIKIQNKLEESYKNLEKLIETQNNIVILTNGKEIKFANQKFFNFLGFKNLTDFKEKHKCICEFFIENDRFFHLKKINEDEIWLDKILELEESKRVVCMKGKDSLEYLFSVWVNNFDDETKIVSFTDISQTILENIYLEEKILHDKLTNAYNREFFENNYKRFIDNCKINNTKLALAILDIDYFKDVNDRFGHDVGDLFLIEFVQVIQKYSRKNDILIRWGGEEFILILEFDSSKDLEKILENLRNSIEFHNFQKVGNKTCSIGATIYKDDEDILKTIKRADESLYDAKNSGRNKVIITY